MGKELQCYKKMTHVQSYIEECLKDTEISIENIGIKESVGFFPKIWYKSSFQRDKKMPKVCEICGKGPVFGQSLSHSHKATKRKWRPNLQQVKAKTDSGAKRMWVCTRCLRSGKVTKIL